MHASDLHIDSPMIGIKSILEDQIENIAQVTRQAFVNLVNKAIALKVDILILAGDIFDGNWKDFSTGIFFVKELTKLSECGIKVIIAQGNHDANNVITKHLRYPPNTKVLSVEEVESIIYEDIGVNIVGRGFPKRSVTDNFASTYPKGNPNLINIGVLHTSLNGRVGHETYAPCSLDDLISKQYTYWALGHVHMQEYVSMEPWIAYSGNLQGRNIRESGEKGALLIEFEGSEVLSVTPIVLDVLQFDTVQVEVGDDLESCLTSLESRFKTFSQLNTQKSYVLRVEITGAGRGHQELVGTRDALDAELNLICSEFDNIYVEKIKVKSRDEGKIDEEKLDFLATMESGIEAIKSNSTEMHTLKDQYEPLINKLVSLGGTDTDLDFNSLIDASIDTIVKAITREEVD